MPQLLRVPLTGGDGTGDPKLVGGPSKGAKANEQKKVILKVNAGDKPVVKSPAGNDISYVQTPVPAQYSGGPFQAPPDLSKRILIHDRRTVNPATGQPFKIQEPKSAKADPKVLSAIIAHAKAKGVDPYTALAIAQQESEFGTKGDVGQTVNYQPDPGLAEMYTTNSNAEANTLAKALKDKLEYAKRLGYDKKGLAYALQAYNGYGNGMDKDPKYGKVIVSLLENLKKNPDIQKMIDETPAYGSDTSNQKLLLKVASK